MRPLTSVVFVSVRPDERREKYSVEGPGVARQHGGSRSKARGHVQISDAIARLGVRSVVFVAQSQIERQIGTESPIVLREEIKRIGAEVVGICARLEGGLLRETQQEVGEIVPRVGYRLRAPGRVL